MQKASGTELLARAHLNGKLSLIALEGRVRLARAATSRQADFLLSYTTFQQRWERLGFEMIEDLGAYRHMEFKSEPPAVAGGPSQNHLR